MVDVTVKNLVKKFRDVIAVNNISFDVKDKEFLVLLGPSGSGKTTVLRCIAGLEVCDAGEIYIGSRVVNDIPPKERNIAMVFQNYALYPHMTVYDNIAFPLKMRKMTSEEISRKVKHTAQMLRIEHLLYRKPGQISGGEAQRVALGRAIVRDPEVFLMDEPLSNLDAKLRVYMRAELKKLQKELGTTTIFVTHDQVEAMTVADKIAIMNLGKLQQVGTPIEIFDKPANQFVAGFIGSPPMNFMECTFVEKNNHYLLDAGTFEIEISEDVGNKIKKEASGSELILGIRPDDIRLEKLVKAEVYLIEPLGREVIIDLKVGDHVLKMKTAFTNFDINVGENIWIGFNKEKIHIFDKKTEKVII